MHTHTYTYNKNEAFNNLLYSDSCITDISYRILLFKKYISITLKNNYCLYLFDSAVDIRVSECVCVC